MTKVQISSDQWQNVYFMDTTENAFEVAAAIAKVLYNMKGGSDDHNIKVILR